MKNVVSPTSSAAPAGWYRDPLGAEQLRWWNGLGWTNHVQALRPEFVNWTPQTAASVA
jgi:hypothetical protein